MELNLLTIIVMFAVVLALAYAAINFYLVKRLKEGNARMQEIAEFYKQFGDKLPAELSESLKTLKENCAK